MSALHLVARDSVATLRGTGGVFLNWLFLVSKPSTGLSRMDRSDALVRPEQVENIVVIILIIFVSTRDICTRNIRLVTLTLAL